MSEEVDELRPADETDETDEADGGGEVKSFLEHLEDLRWVLIKCLVVLTVGMIICLAAGNWLMGVLLWPLEKAFENSPGKNHYVRLVVGTNVLGTYRVDTNQYQGVAWGENQMVTLNMQPKISGAELVMGLLQTTNAPGSILPKTPVNLFNPSPAGGFIVAFQIAVYGGIILTSPFLFYFVIQFVVPALKRKEKKYMGRGLLVGMGLFSTGVSFCYYVLMPLALRASRAYSEWLGVSAALWTAEQYISFVCKFILGMGLGFEMPVILLVFVKLGVLDYQKLAGFRRYMIVINLVLGAVLTTPEVLTQVMMALPLQILYEITVWIAWYWERKEKLKAANPDQSIDTVAS